MKLCWWSGCIRDNCTYCTHCRIILLQGTGDGIFLPGHLVRSACICLIVYTNRQDQDLWHKSSTGYSLVVSVWSCVCFWQYVDILDQFPPTLVSVTLRLMFHHLDCEGWFLIWLPCSVLLASVSICIACILVPGFEAKGVIGFTQHLHRWIGLCFVNEHMLLLSTGS